MRSDFQRLTVQAALTFTLVLTPALALFAGEDKHGHEGDFVVGMIMEGGPAGTLEMEFDSDAIYELPEVDGVLTGFALDDPGFMTLDEDEPDEGIFMLSPDAEIVFELVQSDPAFKIHTPGFASVLTEPGDQWVIGVVPFDDHATWHIDTTHPDYDENQIVYPVTFRLLDIGTSGHAPSEDITVFFTNAECDLDVWSAEDCNLNGIADFCEMAAFPDELDANQNGIIDSCDCEAVTLTPGDANGDGETGIEDVLFLAMALFQGGAHPHNFFVADANESGGANIVDVIYLAEFLFLQGQEPGAPCL